MAEEPKRFTKYEKARIIGARALQISMGAPLLAKLDDKELEDLRYDPIAIAKIEFEQNLIPIDVIRTLPAKRVEEVEE